MAARCSRWCAAGRWSRCHYLCRSVQPVCAQRILSVHYARDLLQLASWLTLPCLRRVCGSALSHLISRSEGSSQPEPRLLSVEGTNRGPPSYLLLRQGCWLCSRALLSLSLSFCPSLGPFSSVWAPLEQNIFSLSQVGICPIPICACHVTSSCSAPLMRVWLCLFYSIPLSSYKHHRSS